VIVPIRDASHTASRTLRQLAEQCEGCSAEVIAAISSLDATVVEVPEGVQLLVVDGLAGIPQLRSAALLAATGEWIVITEDHCSFPPGWLQALVNTCEQHSGTVCGGPVANQRDSFTGWAQYFTRYSAFLPNRTSGLATGLPGNNSCYARAVLFERLAFLQDGFWEAEFNAKLREDRIRFYLSSEAVVTQDQRRGMLEYISLRFRHGRCYGARRSASMEFHKRWQLLVRSPILPLVLFLRIVRSVFTWRFRRARFMVTAPLILIYVLAWSAGEVLGYVAGAGLTCRQTD